MELYSCLDCCGWWLVNSTGDAGVVEGSCCSSSVEILSKMYCPVMVLSFIEPFIIWAEVEGPRDLVVPSGEWLMKGSVVGVHSKDFL